MKYFFIFIIVIFCIFPCSLFSNEENNMPEQEKKPPSHFYNFLYQRIEGPDETINTCDTSFIDTFKINSSASIYNYMFFTYNNIETGREIPPELYKVRETFGFSIDKVRFFFGFTNNTNRPFKSIHDFTLNSTIFYEIYKHGPHSIEFSVIYSSLINRNIGLPIPIPAISYSFKNDEVDFTIGMLTRLVWKPVKFFTFRYQWVPVASCRAVFEFKPAPFIALSTEYVYDKDTYLLNGREERKENLFYEYQRAGERISFYFHRNVSLVVYGGYQFGASYIYGKSEFKRYRGIYRERYVLDNAYIVQAGLRLMF